MSNKFKWISRRLLLFCTIILLAVCVPFRVYAFTASGGLTSLTACNDSLSISWGASNSSNSKYGSVNGSCATANGTNSFIITSAAYLSKYYATTVTVTLTNNNSKTMNLDFSVSGSSPTITPGSGVVTNSVSTGYSYTLDNGESITISLYNESTDAISTTVSGIEFYSNEEVQVTYIPGENGSYSLTVDGETEPVSVTNAAGHRYGYSAVTSISVSANTGYKFVGWMTSTGRLLDYTSGTNLLAKPSGDITVYPYFVPTTAPKYQVGSSYYYYWADAFAASAANGNATVILVESGTISNNASLEKVDGTYVVNNGTASAPSLEYKIPSGFKLLIPYSSTDIGDFDGTPDAQGYEEDVARISTRSAYRTLTVSDGVTVTCTGSINANAQQFTTSGNNPGCVMGQYGHIYLNGTNSKIDVTGNLYCYGYITGTGTVNIQSSGNLYELLQLQDWRGGNAASSAISKKVFPFSQYYVQNVESTLVINSGANAYVNAAIEAGVVSKRVYQTAPVYIGSSGFFQLGSGASITRTYNTSADRLTYTISGGTATVAGMDISLSSYSMNTASYIFALGSNMDIVVSKGATLIATEDYKLLPNLTLIVDGAMDVQGDLYIYDYADWVSGNFVHGGNSDAAQTTHVKIAYIATTGEASTRTLAATSASVTVNGTMTVTGGLYTTSGNSSADKMLKGTGTVTYNPTTAVTSLLEATSRDGTLGWEVYTTEIAVSPVIGNLAGVGDLQSFATGTYYGQSNGYWYQHIISTNIADVITVTSGSGTDGTDLSALDPRIEDGIENIVGLVADEGTITFTVNGDYVVSVGDDELKPDDNGTYTIGKITADTTITLTQRAVHLEAINASANSEIILMLYFTDPYGLLSDTDTVTVTKTTVGANGTTQTEKVYTVSELETDFDAEENKTYYVVRQPAASGEMTSPVTVTFTTSNGSTIPVYDYVSGTCGNSITRTVQDYAERALKLSTDENQIDIIKALVTYGGYSQLYFGKNTDDLAYNMENFTPLSLENVSISREVSTSGNVTGLVQEGQQAFLDSAIKLRVYFVLSSGSIEDYTFTLKRPNGSTATLNTGYEDSNQKYYVDIKDIPAAYLDNDYTITVTRGDETYTVETSVFAYLAKVLAEGSGASEAQKNAAKAMYLYGTAATTFFGK